MEERIDSLKNELEIAVKNSLNDKEKALSFKQMLDDSRKSEVALKCKVSKRYTYDKTLKTCIGSSSYFVEMIPNHGGELKQYCCWENGIPSFIYRGKTKRGYKLQTVSILR